MVGREHPLSGHDTGKGDPLQGFEVEEDVPGEDALDEGQRGLAREATNPPKGTVVASALRQEPARPPQRVAPRRGNAIGDERRLEAVVPGEGLVATVAVEGDRHVPSGLLRHEVRGQGRRVAERLVVVVEQRLHQRGRMRRNDRRVVVAADVARHALGESPLVVERVALEAYREGLHPAGHESRDEGRDGAGVDAAREQDAQRHVGHEALADGLGQQVTNALAAASRS